MNALSGDFLLIFLGMVFLAVFLLSQGLTIPVFGEAGQVRKRIRQRLRLLEQSGDGQSMQVLLRQKYLKRLSPLEAWLEQLPGMERLGRTIEQAGRRHLAYRVVLLGLLLGLTTAMLVWVVTKLAWLALGLGLLASGLPVLRIVSARARRFAQFEEGLPDALDAMCRAMRAGHPFNETLRLVAEEQKGPVAEEFDLAFADIAYGNDMRRAMLGLLERMPSMTVMLLVTSILIHRDTGGNLTEVLERLSRLVRERFRFQRKVRTLSAEGRMSAWVLVSVPFVLAAGIMLTTPGYLPMLINEPLGRKLALAAFVGMLLGIFWIRRIVRIQV